MNRNNSFLSKPIALQHSPWSRIYRAQVAVTPSSNLLIINESHGHITTRFLPNTTLGPGDPTTLCYSSFPPANHILGQYVSRLELLYALVVVTLVYCVSFRTCSRLPIPPGPFLRYAFLGRYPERALHNWAQKYGPLFSLFLGNQLFMVISDPYIAHDLLVTNGKIFSSRKKYFVKNQTILRGRAITATPYDSTWSDPNSLAIVMK